ncbi:MAG: hypothetical protein U0R71_01080 [Solirubrobacterales bacterium]
MTPPHPSDSGAQTAAEATILALLGEDIGVTLLQGREVALGGVKVRPDGMAADGSVVVEVFAHIGKLKGGQRHKVSTDALKLLAIREAHPNARLILAFADETAAASVSGWKAETLKANGIEIHTVDLSPEDGAKIVAAQEQQKMVNAPE